MSETRDYSKIEGWNEVDIPEYFTRNNTVYPPIDEILKDRQLYNKELLGEGYSKFTNYASYVSNLIEVLFDYIVLNKMNPDIEDREGDNNYIYAALRHHKEINKRNFPAFQQPEKPVRRSWLLNPETQEEQIRKYSLLQSELDKDANLPSFNKIISDSLVMFFVKIFEGWHGIELQSLYTDAGDLKCIKQDIPAAHDQKKPAAEVSIRSRLKSIISKDSILERDKLKHTDVELLVHNIEALVDTFVEDHEQAKIIKTFFFNTAPAADLKKEIMDYKFTNYKSYSFLSNIFKEVFPSLGTALASKYVEKNFEKAFNALRAEDCGLPQPDKVFLVDVATTSPIQAVVGFAYREFTKDVETAQEILEKVFNTEVEVHGYLITKNSEEYEIIEELNGTE